MCGCSCFVLFATKLYFLSLCKTLETSSLTHIERSRAITSHVCVCLFVRMHVWQAQAGTR